MNFSLAGQHVQGLSWSAISVLLHTTLLALLSNGMFPCPLQALHTYHPCPISSFASLGCSITSVFLSSPLNTHLS